MPFVTALAVARSPKFDLDTAPVRWNPGAPFESLDLRPGRVVLIGAPPGAGKTTLSLQLVTNMLERYPDLRGIVGNVETSPDVLLEKMIARFASVPLDAIQDRTMTADERARVDAAFEAHADVLGRVAFLEAPYTMGQLRKSMTEFQAAIAVVDYAQRFAARDGNDERQKLDALMSQVRTVASAGACVVVISSVTRGKAPNGSSSYDGLSIASFRGSAEFEFGADSAYILDSTPEGIATLRCVKNRFRQSQDIPLRFCGAFQRFDAGDVLVGFDAASAPTTSPELETTAPRKKKDTVAK